MPTKIIESKLVIKGEDLATPKLVKLEKQLDRLALKLEKVSKISLPDVSGVGGGGAGLGEAFRTTRGSARSDFAPPQTGGRPLPPGIVRVGPGGWQPPPGGGGGGGGGGGAYRPDRFSKYAQGMGWMAQGYGAFMSSAGGQMTPMVTGAMMNAGAQLATVGVPGGKILGKMGKTGAVLSDVLSLIKSGTAAALTATGTAFMIQHAAGQKAIQHYAQFGESYRIMGDLGERAKAIGARTGAFGPDEAIRTMRQLYGVGGQAAFEPLAGMRYKGGIFETELMMPNIMSAIGAGAIGPGKAGARTEEDVRKFAKILAIAFADKTKLPSAVDVMEKMRGLMDISAERLGDLDDGQTKYLSSVANWMTTSTTAALRGPGGVQLMGGMMGKVGGEGSRQEEALKWKVYRKQYPNGNWQHYQYWKDTAEATMGMISGFANYPGGMEGKDPLSGIIGGRFFGMGPGKFKGIAEYAKANPMLTFEQLMASPAGKRAMAEGITYAPTKGEPPQIALERKRVEQEGIRLEISKKYAEGAQIFETAMLKFADLLNEKTGFSTAIADFGKYTEDWANTLKAILPDKGESSYTLRDIDKRFRKWFEAPENPSASGIISR